MPLKIGFSTGCLHSSLVTDYGKISAIRKIGCRAIELSFLRLGEFTEARLFGTSWDVLEGFEHRSIHAPIHPYTNDGATNRIFEKLAFLHEKIKPHLIVFHPDTVIDFDVFNGLSFPVGFENMDNRKKSFKTPDELAELMAKNKNFKFVLDLNHICSNDPTMRSAVDFYDQLGSRLAEIHLSGYNGHHVPLFRTEQAEIVNAIQNFDIPIIIESVVAPDELGKELTYIEKQILISGRA
jgi:hypothetical protein